MPARAYILALMGLVASSTLWAQAPVKRSPVPTDTALAEAKKLVGDVYKSEYVAAKTPDKKRELANKLLAEAKATMGDPVTQYACAEIAQNMAVAIGDAELALATVSFISEHFDVDRLELQLDAFGKAAANSKVEADHYFALQQVEGLIQDATKANRWKEAIELGKLAETSAKKARDLDWAKSWTDRLRILVEQQAGAASLTEALETLQKSPSDAAANAEAGKLLCFVMDDWSRGIPMLALGSDKPTQTIAEQELRGAKTSAEQVALADAWYDLAAKYEGLQKQTVQRHALELYRKAEPALTGLAKTRLQKRIGELFGATMPDRIPLSAVKMIEYRALAGTDGTWIVAEVAKRRFPNSLWAHAPNASGASVAVFELPCEFKYIKGMCAFHKEVEPRTAVQFRMNCDGAEAWKARERLAMINTLVPFRVDLRGKRRLELIIDCPGDHHGSHTVWVSPVLQK